MTGGGGYWESLYGRPQKKPNIIERDEARRKWRRIATDRGP